MANAKQDEKIKALFIRSRGDSFRRCGFRFTKDGVGVAVDALSKKEIEQLQADPEIFVQEAELLRSDCINPE